MPSTDRFLFCYQFFFFFLFYFYLIPPTGSCGRIKSKELRNHGRHGFQRARNWQWDGLRQLNGRFDADAGVDWMVLATFYFLSSSSPMINLLAD